jgi:hypothetical protein
MSLKRRFNLQPFSDDLNDRLTIGASLMQTYSVAFAFYRCLRAQRNISKEIYFIRSFTANGSCLVYYTYRNYKIPCFVTGTRKLTETKSHLRILKHLLILFRGLIISSPIRST